MKTESNDRCTIITATTGAPKQPCPHSFNWPAQDARDHKINWVFCKDQVITREWLGYDSDEGGKGIE
jgi:hypothetical protein